MNCIEYQIIESNIKILDVKFNKLHLKENILLLSKPWKIFKNRYRNWEEELNSLLDEERIIYDDLFNEYNKIEKLLSK